MFMPTSPKSGNDYVLMLQPLDFAFFLNSDENRAYGIVTDIIGLYGMGDNNGVEPQGHEAGIRFALDSWGNTKTI